MQHKYRKIYAFIISMAMIMVAIFYDIAPTLSHISVLHQMKSQWMKKRIEMQIASQKNQMEMLKSDAKLKSSIDCISEVVMLAEREGLFVQTIETRASSVRSFEMTRIHLVALGHFNQLTAFVEALSREQYPVIILDFTLKILSQAQMTLAMDLMLFRKRMMLNDDHKHHQSNLHSLLCQSENLNASIPKTINLQTIPMSAMRMMGYIADGNKRSAFILLPNKTIALIENGARLGREQGIVTEISEDHVDVLLPDNKRWVIEK